MVIYPMRDSRDSQQKKNYGYYIRIVVDSVLFKKGKGEKIGSSKKVANGRERKIHYIYTWQRPVINSGHF